MVDSIVDGSGAKSTHRKQNSAHKILPWVLKNCYPRENKDSVLQPHATSNHKSCPKGVRSITWASPPWQMLLSESLAWAQCGPCLAGCQMCLDHPCTMAWLFSLLGWRGDRKLNVSRTAKSLQFFFHIVTHSCGPIERWDVQHTAW